MPKVKWDRSEGKDSIADDGRWMENHHELIVKNVHREDAGTYTCTGDNGQEGSAPITGDPFTLRVEGVLIFCYKVGFE